MCDKINDKSPQSNYRWILTCEDDAHRIPSDITFSGYYFAIYLTGKYHLNNSCIKEFLLRGLLLLHSDWHLNKIISKLLLKYIFFQTVPPLYFANYFQANCSLLALKAQHISDWLFGLPITTCGLRSSDEATRVACTLRLNLDLLKTHTWTSIFSRRTSEPQSSQDSHLNLNLLKTHTWTSIF